MLATCFPISRKAIIPWTFPGLFPPLSMPQVTHRIKLPQAGRGRGPKTEAQAHDTDHMTIGTSAGTRHKQRERFTEGRAGEARLAGAEQRGTSLAQQPVLTWSGRFGWHFGCTFLRLIHRWGAHSLRENLHWGPHWGFLGSYK